MDGCVVRGPLDICESRGRPVIEVVRVLSHVLMMREKLAQMSELVQKNMKKAQQKQKTWYDCNSRERDFQPADEVLVLLPTTTNKLLAQWQGPYRVLCWIGKVDYVIDMHDRRKRHRTFHVNMLRKWHEPAASAFTAMEEVADEPDGEDVPLWNGEPSTAASNPVFGEQLTSEQQHELQGLLKEFADVMQNQPGRTDVAEHTIDTGAARPVKLPPYRLPHAHRETVQREIEEMLEAGIIEPSQSEWSAPIVLVKKKDGTLRLCVDYRRLNSVSKSDVYPMPRIDDLIDQLGKVRYLTTLDLTRGYWQVPVVADARHKTAFATLFGLYQFTVMPFGLQGAPATFQRLMDRVLHGVGDFAAAYLDDIVIFSETWEDHLTHVRSVLSRLQASGLTAKPSKCQFGMAQCVYLGHIVGSGLVKPEHTKIQAVQQTPPPQTKKQVRAFLGLTGYYRRFIPDYASIAAPLSDLTRKNTPAHVTWTAVCEHSFQQLKTLLCTSPVLQAPDFDRPFTLQTDASDAGLVLFSANMMMTVWNTQWLTTVENSCHVRSITPLLRRSVWQSSSESMLSVFISWGDPLLSKLTIGPWSGLTV